MPTSSEVLRLPEHLRKRQSFGKKRFIQNVLREGRLNTVCEDARCPNIAECFGNNTATFMIMGDRCTRRCHFCSVKTAKPLPLNPLEPFEVALAAQKMNLDYVVITSVDRDDLPDGGAWHFRKVVGAVMGQNPGIKVEVLTSDFKGNTDSLDMILTSGIKVFSHNTETVSRLYKKLRPQSDFERTLGVLRYASARKPPMLKTGMMVGLGESDNEVIDTMALLKDIGVDIVTIGQYLRPSLKHWPVERYVKDESFDKFRKVGKDLGFKNVYAGSFVRSSYHAKEVAQTTSTIALQG